MSNEETCPICKGSGMTQSGQLDCSYNDCAAATERAAFNERLGYSGPWMLMEVAWQAYQMGRKDEREARHGRE